MGHEFILLVEDDDTEAMLMGMALRKNGVTVDVSRAQDGAEALDILFSADGNRKALPSVVFLDLNLPKVSGLEVLRASGPRTACACSLSLFLAPRRAKKMFETLT